MSDLGFYQVGGGAVGISDNPYGIGIFAYIGVFDFRGQCKEKCQSHGYEIICIYITLWGCPESWVDIRLLVAMR